MLTQEMVVTIHVLNKQGYSIKAISRELGIARNTVRKYIRNDDAMPRYQRKSARPSKLDPYKDYLHQRIEQAAPDWIPAAVLYREVVALGYDGKIRILSDYVAQFKPAPSSDPLVRFETAPGEQLQVDFTHIKRGKKPPLKAFVATLGYSRASYVHFFDNERSESWLTGLRQCFDFFGGVPREVLFDNAKSIIIARDAYGHGQHRWHPELLDLAKEYGFKPRVCRPYRAKTKGKVERFNRYLKESFALPLAIELEADGLVLDVPTANGRIGHWLASVANARVHGTTHAIPNERLHEEQAVFLPLPIRGGDHVVTRSATQRPMPIESLQHPLSIYDEVIGGAYEFAI
ncbi:Transposase and inactivated derivatives [Oligella urethralis]|uniref:IS21 family transposase n=1 Tax=Oligella urethralis TaxID=90245 RepID=UPI000DFFD297|nr:IS21 family transposase [Oligella urethralis]SUA60358.1 Transposase and inactivated derivatives [Oligella urethralis]